MRTRILVPLLAAGALVLAGCGEEDAGTPGGTPPAADPTDGDADGDADGDGDEGDEGGGADGDGDDPDPDPFHQRAEQIADAWPERPEPPARHRDALWPVQAVEPADPADTALTVTVGYGGCDGDWGTWLHETDDLVIVGGWTVRDPEVEACHDMLLTEELEVELAQELGDRQVLDAVTVRDPRDPDYHTER